MPGKKQEVRIYYSEFKDRTFEKVADWYSDVADFKLWLVQPNGKRVQLPTQAQEDHFTASFVPEQAGSYRLEIGHTAGDPGEGTAYQFNAFAQAWAGEPLEAKRLPVGAAQPELVLAEELQLTAKPATKVFRSYFKGEPVGGISATLFLPSGKTETITSNAEGLLEVELKEKGIYFLEATTYHESEAGRTKKAPYQSVWRCATQKIEF
ncbi:hypothetical protein [Nafulsella turpanensis]|uniref:hypothetical protein n=1 Tax=Nafulsella turpanensis TaxID=1265690 RepID=UPI00034ADE24|nr:hypothetical protein [Nafulsella turpanensis]